MKKIISAFAVLALALVIPCVASSPSANADLPSNVSCANGVVTINTANTAAGTGTWYPATCATITVIVITGPIADIRSTLISAQGNLAAAASQFGQSGTPSLDLTNVTIAPTDTQIALVNDDLNFIAEAINLLTGKVSGTAITGITVTLDAGNKAVDTSNLTDAAIPSYLGANAVNVVNASNADVVAAKLVSIGAGNVKVGSQTAQAIVDAANAPAPAPAPQGEQAVASTATDSVVLGFGVFALIALAGSVLATRKLVRK